MVGINGNETADISAAGMDDTHVVQDTRTKAVGEHQKRGHRPKVDGCDACEKAYMQSAPARQGAKIRGNLNTVNGDLLDFVHQDNNGNRYGFDIIETRTSYGDLEMMPSKDSTTAAKAWQKMLARMESISSPGRPEDYRVERFQHDHGTEFEGAFKQCLDERNIINTHGEVGRHTACSRVENRNKLLTIMGTAMGQQMTNGNEDIIKQAQGELVTWACQLLNNDMLTSYQKENSITAYREQTGRDSPLRDRPTFTFGSLAFGFVSKKDRTPENGCEGNHGDMGWTGQGSRRCSSCGTYNMGE